MAGVPTDEYYGDLSTTRAVGMRFCSFLLRPNKKKMGLAGAVAPLHWRNRPSRHKRQVQTDKVVRCGCDLSNGGTSKSTFFTFAIARIELLLLAAATSVRLTLIELASACVNTSNKNAGP